MRFEVPQFIEIEDKVVGPLTFKQFVYIVGGGGLAFVLFAFLPKAVGIPLAGVVVLLAVALAFYKVNNKPFVFFIENFFKYVISGKLYIWKKEEEVVPQRGAPQKGSSLYVPKIADSKLKDLSWSLDVKTPENPL